MKEIRKVHISVSSNVGTSMNKGTVAATGLSGALKGVGTSANLATGGIKAMTMALISSGVGALVVGLGALVAGFGAVINKSAEFSVGMSNLKAIIGADKDESIFARLAKDAKRLGASTAFTATQVVELQTEFAKLGFTTDEIIGATEATLNLAAATKTDLATAAAVAGGTMRGFGMTAQETGRITDVMALSFSSSTLDISKFQESMKYVAPVAKLMKVSIEEATASLGILADNQVSGSMAGTNLRKVISKLSLATGKGYRESLEIVSKKLAAATTESEKLAIAQKLVGDRAYGTLITLAEALPQLDGLTDKLENSAEGYAKLAAEAQLDNLTGDVTKLGSAWEGFLLGMEDGNGILSKMARGAMQGLTLAVQGITQGFRDMSRDWNLIGVAFKKGGNWFMSLGAELDMLGVQFDTFAIDALLALADVPFFGGAVDKETLLKEQADLKNRHAAALKSQKEFATRALELDKEADQIKYDYIMANAKATSDDEARVMKSVMGEFREGEAGEEDDAAKKKIEDRKIFLDKLKKLQEDTEDQTEAEKIERKRARHLAELATITMETEERRIAAEAIDTIYDQLRLENKEKTIAAFKKNFVSDDDPIAKIERERAAHLLEMQALELNLIEKREMEKTVNEYYDGLVDAANTETAAKKNALIEQNLEKEQAAREAKIQGMFDVLDAASNAAGQESEIARALQALKLAMQLKELAMKMGIIKDELAVKASAVMTEVSLEGAKTGTAIAGGMAETSKVGFPWNVITMAGYALQAATLIKSFAGAKKKVTSIAGAAGGSGSGGGAAAAPRPPSYNVIGQTSAGDNMIADTIAGVNDRPMRAYVVDSDVTSTQELSRNTANEASIG